MEASEKFLQDYLNSCAPPGRELSCHDLWRKYVEAFSDRIIRDPYGSVAAIQGEALAWSWRSTAMRSPGSSILSRLYSQRGESLVRSQVSHAPYRVRQADVEQSSTIPARLDGFKHVPNTAEHTCFVDGFDVDVYATFELNRP
jgi:hypothetical protein